MLYKINLLRYSDFIAIADTHNCGKVYPPSIAEGIKKGNIFISSMENYNNVLFWAYCGFAYLLGKADECFLEDIYEFMLDRTKLDSRRFLLMTRDEAIQEYFKSKQDVIVEKRYLFEYSKNREIVEPILPVGYELKEIDNQLLEDCITCDNDIASWAFSAAVSSKEIDIGIETNPQYKQQGLGLIVAQKMIQYTIGHEKEPVWACHYRNAASERMAEKLGFVKVSECFVIKCKY